MACLPPLEWLSLISSKMPVASLSMVLEVSGTFLDEPTFERYSADFRS